MNLVTKSPLSVYLLNSNIPSKFQELWEGLGSFSKIRYSKSKFKNSETPAWCPLGLVKTCRCIVSCHGYAHCVDRINFCINPSLIFPCRKIKVWDLQAALDPQAAANTLCLFTLVKHSRCMFCLQFDKFQIISGSHDDTICIWDFLNVPPSAQNETLSPSRTYTCISR